MTGDHKKNAVVIGGGSWGCAIAAALLQAGTPAQLLVRSPDTADALARGVCRQLSDAPVLPPLDARTEDSILDTAGLVFVVLPVSATANCLEQLAGRLAPDVPVALCAKGLMATADTAGMLMPELAGHLLPDHHAVVFSGPTFADEVASGKPAAITAASHNAQAANIIQQAFEGSASGGNCNHIFHRAANRHADRIIAGINPERAAIITRGLAEMARFATALGANPGTIYGLSGAGDLALSCAGPHSRNMAFGLALGAGRTPDPVLAEGRHTVAAMVARGRASGIELPITEAVDKVVNQNHNLQDVVSGLLARRAGNE